MTERERARSAARRLAIIRHAEEVSRNVSQTYPFGPQKIAMYVRRYHELVVSASGIWRILRRLGLGRLPSSQRYVPYHKRWQRYEKPEPGHQVQLDVKFIAPLKGSRRRHYQFTAIDDCTRLRVLRIYERLNQKTAIQFFDYVLQKLPFRVERIQTDNGAELRKDSRRKTGASQPRQRVP